MLFHINTKFFEQVKLLVLLNELKKVFRLKNWVLWGNIRIFFMGLVEKNLGEPSYQFSHFFLGLKKSFLWEFGWLGGLYRSTLNY